MATPTPEKLLELIKEKNVKWVDLQFMDIPGDAIDMWIELKSEEYKQNSIRSRLLSSTSTLTFN